MIATHLDSWTVWLSALPECTAIQQTHGRISPPSTARVSGSMISFCHIPTDKHSCPQLRFRLRNVTSSVIFYPLHSNFYTSYYYNKTIHTTMSTSLDALKAYAIPTLHCFQSVTDRQRRNRRRFRLWRFRVCRCLQAPRRHYQPFPHVCLRLLVIFRYD